MGNIYFDNAATTLLKPAAVISAVCNTMRTCSSPGRGAYSQAARAAETVYECRQSAAELFNVKNPENVVLTMNATHALNLAIKSVVPPHGRAIVSGYEHNSVMRPLAALSAEVTIIRTALFDKKAYLEELQRVLSEVKPDAVICTHVSNVFGFILPVGEAALLSKRSGAAFILDASQSAGALRVDATALGADFIAMPGHKGLYGPQGTGLLLCNAPSGTLIEGGTGSDSASRFMPDYLPDRLEAGTHNVPGAAGLAEGIRFILKRGTDSIWRHEQILKKRAVIELRQLPEIQLYASCEPEAQSAVISFNIRNIDCETVAEHLGRNGVAVRSGLHCSPQAHMSAGTFDTGTVRISFSVFNSLEQLDQFSKTVKKVIKTLKTRI